MFELLTMWRLAEHALVFVAGIASAFFMGAIAILIMLRNRVISVELGLSQDWRDSLRQGLIFGLVVILLGIIFDSMDFRPLNGFLTRQPLPVGSLVGVVTTGLLGMARWIIGKNEAEHKETRQMLKDHMAEEERISQAAKDEVSHKFDRFEHDTHRRLDELRELILAAIQRK